MEVFVLWGIIGVIVGALIGDRKGRAGAGAILGFLLGPIGWIVIGLGPDYKQLREGKKCPFCAELIKKEALVCRYCGRELPLPDLTTVATAAEKSKPISLRTKIWILIIVALGVVLLVFALSGHSGRFPRQATLTVTIYPQDGSAALPVGTSVELLSKEESPDDPRPLAHIRYAGREFVVPSSAVADSK